MSFVLGIVLLIGLIALITVAARRGGPEENGDTGQAVRRFFQYLLMYGLLQVVASGATGLLSRLFDRQDLVRLDDAQLARSLTFVIIGLPSFLALGVWALRRLRTDEKEGRSFGWALYLTAASITALVAAMFSLYDVLTWGVGVAQYEGGSIPGALVWVAIWVVHRRVEARTTPPGRSQVHHLLGSLIGLGTATAGLSGLIGWALQYLVDTGPDLVAEPEDSLLRSVVMLAIGGAVWIIYWLRLARNQPRSGLWLGYVLVVGVAGGLLALLSSASLVLYEILVWFLGDPTAPDVARHFGDVPDSVGTALVAGLIWWYHRVLVAEREGPRTEAGRVYEYLIAGVGLLAAAAGVATVLVAVLEALAGAEGVVVSEGATNTLLAAFTLLAVGVPVWWLMWRRIQAAVAADSDEEVASRTRRIYLFILFGIGGVTTLIGLITAVFVFLEDVIEDRLGAETIRSLRFAIATVVTTAAVAGYHWAVYRQDHRRAAPVPRGPRYVLLIGPPDGEAARELSRRTGGRVEVWSRTDVTSPAWDVDHLADSLSWRDDENVIVLAGPDGFDVVPVDRDSPG